MGPFWRNEVAHIEEIFVLLTLIMEALLSSETSVLIRSTRRDIPEDAILHSHRRENLKSYVLIPVSHIDRDSTSSFHRSKTRFVNFTILIFFPSSWGQRTWLRHYARSRKGEGSIPDEATEFLSIYVILAATPWPWADSDSNTKELQELCWI
jgi:hypothetical protein